MASQISNNFTELASAGTPDFDNDIFNIILMEPGFTFSRASHDEYADVSAFELPTALGYTAGGEVLAGVATTRSDVLNATTVTWNNVVWTAVGGNLQSCGAIIIDDTLVNDPVVGFIDFGGTMTAYNGGAFTVANIAVALSSI